MHSAITQAELEANCNCLTTDWPPPEDPIEDLWLHIHKIQCFTLASNKPISDSTVLHLMLEVLEKTDVVFLSATECWRELDKAAWMLPTFQLHFTKADKECHRKLTAQMAGYHSAHTVTMPNATPIAAAAVASATPAAPPFSININGCTMMYYCWSHGLGQNIAHTSPTCNNKAPGHQDTATMNNQMGGS
jgi:hypothetical protein